MLQLLLLTLKTRSMTTKYSDDDGDDNDDETDHRQEHGDVDGRTVRSTDARRCMQLSTISINNILTLLQW